MCALIFTSNILIIFFATYFFSVSYSEDALSDSLKETTYSELNKIPLIKKSEFFSPAQFLDPFISPDGKSLAYLAPVNGVMNIWVKSLIYDGKAYPVTKEIMHGIYDYCWSFDNQTILYSKDQEGDENWNIYKVDVLTKKNINLTPLKGVQVKRLERSYKRPKEIVIGLNDRNPAHHDLYILNIETGHRTLLLKNDSFSNIIIEPETYRVLFGFEPDGLGGYILKRFKDKKIENWIHIPVSDGRTTSLFNVIENGAVYMLSSINRDKCALILKNLETKEETILLEHSRSDISGVFFGMTDNHLLGAYATYLRKDWISVDPLFKKDIDYFKKQFPNGDIRIVSRSLKDDLWTIEVTYASQPLDYYLYDRSSQKLTFLFTHRPMLRDKPIGNLYPIVIKARDGLELPSYLTLPTYVDQGDGKASHPVPLVLMVHGGPWGFRDSFGYDSVCRWLANRGYAVLQVNYRGSGGFGKNFINKSIGEFARKMHTDLLDGVEWAIHKGITTRDKVCIMGTSYGGYAVLVGMTMTPDVFSCGVDIVGISNWITDLAAFPPYWKAFYKESIARMNADPKTTEGRRTLKKISPLFYADKIKKPLLIGHGANDPRVKKAESDQMVKEMIHHKIPVVYAVYPDEGHGFERSKNKMSFWTLTEHFLAKILGGRSEPMTSDDFNGSSLILQRNDVF